MASLAASCLEPVSTSSASSGVSDAESDSSSDRSSDGSVSERERSSDGELEVQDEPRSRRRKRRGSAGLFARGGSRAPYKKTWTGLEEDNSSDEEGDQAAGQAKVCGCKVVLSAHVESFHAMKITGVELKKRQRYQPKGDPAKSYRDLNSQNSWLLANVFDASGNFLYCKACIMSALCISHQRLTRLRKVKRSGTPAVHGLASKPSNRSNPMLKAKFLDFVDASRAPNGRRVGSSSAEYFFDAAYTSFRAPDTGADKYEEKARRSVVGAFNLSQQADALPTCSNNAARYWLQKNRPSTTICPQKTDYCDVCKTYNEEISRAQTTMNRMHESGNAVGEALEAQGNLAESYRLLLQEHKATAQASIDEYKRQRAESQRTWRRIAELDSQPRHELGVAALQELAKLKEEYVCTIDADYQMGKLIPHWGYTAQPSSSYYKQKLSYDNFGVVCHGSPDTFFYLFHEGAAGSKCADHTISCLDHFIQTHVPSWVRHVVIVLDNAMVNKNQFTVGWLGQLVNAGRFDSTRLLLMIPGHTKFSPDEAFARVAHTFYKEDVFTGEELAVITGKYGLTYTLDGGGILRWKSVLPGLYKPVPGIKDLHDFVWSYPSAELRPQLNVRKLCSGGDYTPVTLYRQEEGAVPDLRDSLISYEDAHECPAISPEKMAHLVDMYDRWISPDRRLEFLPPYQPTVVPQAQFIAAAAGGPITSALAQAHEEQRARRKCSTPGCSGQGHKNIARWAEGHTTRSGCPIHHKVLPPVAQ